MYINDGWMHGQIDKYRDNNKIHQMNKRISWHQEEEALRVFVSNVGILSGKHNYLK